MEITELKRIAESSRIAGQKSSDVTRLDEHILAMRNLKSLGVLHADEFSLSDIEALSIVMLEGFSSSILQEAAYNPQKSNELLDTLLAALNNAIIKAPRHSHTPLYINDGFERCNNKVGNIFNVKGYLTTSVDDFDNASFVKWIVEPLPNEVTRSHEIYKIYNHGEEFGAIPEYQVEFERNTPFEIVDIQKGEKYDTIFIKERIAEL